MRGLSVPAGEPDGKGPNQAWELYRCVQTMELSYFFIYLNMGGSTVSKEEAAAPTNNYSLVYVHDSY